MGRGLRGAGGGEQGGRRRGERILGGSDWDPGTLGLGGAGVGTGEQGSAGGGKQVGRAGGKGTPGGGWSAPRRSAGRRSRIEHEQVEAAERSRGRSGRLGIGVWAATRRG